MTAVPLLDAHKGCHCQRREPSPLAKFLRRAIAAVRRRKAAPAGVAAGAATPDRFPCCPHCLTGSPCEPQDNHLAPCEGCSDVLGDRMLAQVRAQWNAWHDDDVHARPHPATEPAGFPVLSPAQAHADAMNAGYANAVDRLRLEAGLPTVAQMREMRAGSPPWLFPPLEEPLWDEPEPRGPVHDTRMDLYAPHCAPDVPVYGQAPVARVLEAERLASVMRP